MSEEERKPYILILPGLFTTGNLFCGYYAIIQAFAGQLDRAAYAILMAGIFDALDGRVARMTRSHSDFGVQYDSVADVVSFALAPAIMMYQAGLNDLGRTGLIVTFFYVVCGALRLARFNSTQAEGPGSFFEGLPSPAAANMVGGCLMWFTDQNLQLPGQFFMAMSLLLGLLMVSSVRYRSFKDLDIRHRRRFYHLVLSVMIVVFMAIKHEVTIPIMLGAYIIWSPILEVGMWLKRRVNRGATLTQVKRGG